MEKELWECPHTIVEFFEPNEFIAKCTLKITKDTLGGANYVNPNHYKKWGANVNNGTRHSGGNTSGRVENVFTEKSTNCVTIVPTTGITAHSGRYLPLDNNEDLVYLFNTNSVVTYSSVKNSDSCYGTFQYATDHSETTAVPFS